MTTASESRSLQAPLKLTRWVLLASLIVLIDQLSKLWFDSALRYGERLNVLFFFDFTLLYNRGAAFSFLADQPGWQRWFFTILGLGASGFILWMMHKNRNQSRLLLALTLILGGALGNVIDRLAYGHVIDFLLFYWQNWYYPAFNIADTCITLGAILLILDEVIRLRGHHARSS
ncbi:MAG: signal peptidase II [Alcaligenaceae bacterium]|jgi:signal peptidase II